MDDISQGIVDQQVRATTEAVETMVERMLVLPGGWGVIVYCWNDGDLGRDNLSFRVQAELSHDVDPMTVGYAPLGVKPGELFG